MNKGVIVQFEYDKAIVLKNDGSFISYSRNPHWQIGDVIGVPRKKFSFKMIILSILILLTILTGAGLVIYQNSAPAIPNEYVDTNPHHGQGMHRHRHQQNRWWRWGNSQ